MILRVLRFSVVNLSGCAGQFVALCTCLIPLRTPACLPPSKQKLESKLNLSSSRCAVAQLAKFRIAGITRGAGRTDAGKRSTAGRRQEERRGVWVVAGKLRDLLVLIAQAVENAVAGSDNQLGSELVREAKSRPEIVMITVDDRPAEAVLPRKRESACFEIEETPSIARVHGLRVKVIADTKIERKLPSHFPVVLEVGSEVNLALPPPVEHLGPLDGRREPQQEVGQRSAEPGESELDVKIEPNTNSPKKGEPLSVSNRVRRTSAPVFKVWLPLVMLMLSAQWNRFSMFRLELPTPHDVNCCEPLIAPEKLKAIEGNPLSGKGNKATRFFSANSTPSGASPRMLPLCRT